MEKTWERKVQEHFETLQKMPVMETPINARLCKIL